jgi:hypothetical protein
LVAIPPKDITGKKDTMRNDEIITRPKKTDLLPEKVMPFAEDIDVALPLDRSQEVISDLDMLTDILIVVNGEIKLRYSNEPNRMGYKQWLASNISLPNTNTYLCPVNKEETLGWRGLVQAYIKRYRSVPDEDSTETPYEVVPLFVARKGPESRQANGKIELAYEMNVSMDGITLTINAILLNTNGRIVIEGLADGNWVELVILEGESSRSDSWTSGVMLFDWAETNQIRAYDVRCPDSINAYITLTPLSFQ